LAKGAAFMADALALTRQFYAPPLPSVLPQTLAVLAVVAAFMVAACGIDAACGLLVRCYQCVPS
jgi:hypothetical protein